MARVARKRFWRWQFPVRAGSRAGRPRVQALPPRSCARRAAPLRRLTNNEIGKHPQYSDFSLDQGKLSIEDFSRSHGRRDVALSRSIRCAP